jgi:hypothetical protein
MENQNDYLYPQIIEYITNFKENPIIIPDTLGTKLVIEKELMFNDSDSIIRTRDQDHPYAYITDRLRWALIAFSTDSPVSKTVFLKAIGFQLKVFIVSCTSPLKVFPI